MNIDIHTKLRVLELAIGPSITALHPVAQIKEVNDRYNAYIALLSKEEAPGKVKKNRNE